MSNYGISSWSPYLRRCGPYLVLTVVVIVITLISTNFMQVPMAHAVNEKSQQQHSQQEWRKQQQRQMPHSPPPSAPAQKPAKFFTLDDPKGKRSANQGGVGTMPKSFEGLAGETITKTMLAEARTMLQTLKSFKKTYWIVVTSIQAPTEQVRALANMTGWQLLVVGDTKSPKQWSLHNVIYLGIAEQKALGYKIHDAMPYGRYCRKNIGYLFAIQHGAEYIYDTDDDNVPTVSLDNYHLTSDKTSALIIQTKNLTYNPLRHFGQSSIWPRGYPLSKIGLPDPHEYSIEEIPAPAIKQGLVNGDPDIDAIFRLTRKHAKKQLSLTFDGAAPPVVLPEGTFAPMNAQNTLYSKRAFWSMALIFTVTDRVNDIYRSYWAQRLLWLAGDKAAFYPPSAYQVRNGHSYLVDAKLETLMYQEAEIFLETLLKWQCSKKTFVACVIDLTKTLCDRELIGIDDVHLISAWLMDLHYIGFQFPTIANVATTKSTAAPTIFYPNEQPTSSSISMDTHRLNELTNVDMVDAHLRKICGSKYIPGTYKTKLKPSGLDLQQILVVGVEDATVIPHIEAVHRPVYSNVIYCTSGEHARFFHQWKLTNILVKPSVNAFRCLQMAASMNHITSGYIYITQSTLIRYKDAKAVNHPWLAKANVTSNSCQLDKTKLQDMSKTIERIMRTGMQSPSGMQSLSTCITEASKWTTADLMYIPERFTPFLNLLSDVNKSTNSCNADSTLAALLGCVDKETVFLSPVDDVKNTKEYFFPRFNYKSMLASDNQLRPLYCSIVTRVV